MVFESEDYKKQKEEFLRMKEEERVEDEEPNNAQFYSKLLQSRERRGDPNDTPRSIIANKEDSQEDTNIVHEETNIFSGKINSMNL